MQWPGWTKKLIPRRPCRQDRHRSRPQHLSPFLPRIYRLEDRRVLDVSAAFSSATGQLELLLTNSAESATISVVGGNLTVTDSQQRNVQIHVDGGSSREGQGAVNASTVDSIHVTGDAASGQLVQFTSPLALPKGLVVDASIEQANLRADLTRIDQGPVRIDAAQIQLGGDVITTGQDISFGGAIRLSDDIRLSGLNITFAGTVDDDGVASTGGGLFVEASGLARFGAAVGALAPLSRVETDSSGRTELNGDITAHGNTVLFNNPVTLTNHSTITDTGSTGIIFASTVDSASGSHFGLTLAAPNGQVKFNGSIGAGSLGDQRLGFLTIDDAGNGVVFGETGTVPEVRVAGPIDIGAGTNVIGGAGIVLGGGPLGMSITLDGTIRLNGPTVLESDVRIATSGGNITFTSEAAVDSQVNLANGLTLDAGSGAVFFNADLGSTLPLRGLTVTRADGGVTFGAADTKTAVNTGPVRQINSVDPITIGAGTNVIVGSIIFNAGNGNTLRVTTTNDTVSLNGPVTLHSGLSISTGPGSGDIRFRSGTIDSETGENNDLLLNAGAGSISFNKNLGATTPLGSLIIAQADGGVTFGTADTASGGAGPVTQLVARSAIDIGAGANEIAGTGILLNGGSAGVLTVTSQTDDVRLNGAVTLDTDVTINAGGDVTFTNDSPVDSRAGEIHSLTIDAVAGSVSFHEDLGRTTPLGSLTVTQARDGVFLGGATNEIPGTGGLGPVEIVRLDGSLNFGVGTSVIGGAGIVLSGSAIAPQTITTTDDSVRMNGAVTLQTDVAISTGTSGADILFTNATPIDSGPIRHGSLTLDASGGRIEFNEDLGGVRLLGSLTVKRADGGVVFGGDDVESSGPDGAGPVNAIRTDQPIDIGAGANVIGGQAIVFNGGAGSVVISTTDDNVRLNGQVRLRSDLAIDTGDGPGDVIFTSATTIDSDDGPLSGTNIERNDLFVDAGDGGVFFNANVGSNQPIDTLIIDRAARGVVFGGADIATVGGAGPVTLVRTDGAVDLGTGTTPDDTLGSVVFNAGGGNFVLETFGNDLRVNGPTVLQSDVALHTGSGDLEFTTQATIDSQTGESHFLLLDLENGDGRLRGEIGGTTRLGTLAIISVHNLDFDAAVTAATIRQNEGSGRTTFHGHLNTNHATQRGLELGGTDFTFDSPVLATGDGRVEISHTGLLDINPGADFRIDGLFASFGSGPVQLAGNLATSGDWIEFLTPVTITDGASGPVLLSTVAGAQVAPAVIYFRSSLDGQVPGAERVLLNVGTNGLILFQGAVGDAIPLGTLTVIQARNVNIDRLTAERFHQLDGQGLTFFGRTNLNHSTLPAIEVKTQEVRFADMVTTTGHGGVTLDVSDSVSLHPGANMTLNGAFQQVGTATVHTSADITTSGDDITFAGPVLLNDDVRLDTGSGPGSIRFDKTLDSSAPIPRDLILNAGTGDIAFNGAIGLSLRLDQLQVDTARNVSITTETHVGALLQSLGSGTTTVDGAVTTFRSNGVRLTTNTLVLNGTLDTRGGPIDGPVTLIATDDIHLNGRLLTNAATISIAASDDVLFGPQALVRSISAPISITADSDGTIGGEVAMLDGSVVDSGSATLVVIATDNITVGRLVTKSQATLTSAAGAILDGGDATGADLVAATARLQAARGIGSVATGAGKDAREANPLETQISVLAASNSVSGGIQITNRGVGDLTIGTVDGLAGLDNGGPGSIAISNLGSLFVEQAIRNHGGGDTSLRAEFPGDLVVDAPIQNSGGDGSIFLFAGGDLVIHDSLPEPPGKVENPPNPEQFFEIMVTGQGAVRGEAHDDVLVDDGDSNYVIVHTATGQITNVPPILTIQIIDQGGSDIDEQGRGFIQVTLGDDTHLETNYHIQIDWGDGEIESFPIPGTIHPLREPGNQDPRFNSGETGLFGTREPGVYTFTHKYFQHPNPDDPSTPIPIRVELRYDARPSGSVVNDANRPEDGSAVFNGIRFINQVASEVFSFQEDTFSVPGTGNFTFIKIVESVIVPVELRTVAPEPPVQTAISFTASAGVRGDFRTVSLDIQSQEEYRLFMTVVDDVAGTESTQRIDLSLEWLNDPLALFRSRRFPNGHYRVYLEEIRTRRVRLILDVHIFNGKVVPPNYREGAGEKQPGADQSPDANAPVPAQPKANQYGAFPAIDQDARLATVIAEPAPQPWESDNDRWLAGVDAALTDAPRSMTKAARLWRKLNRPS